MNFEDLFDDLWLFVVFCRLAEQVIRGDLVRLAESEIDPLRWFAGALLVCVDFTTMTDFAFLLKPQIAIYAVRVVEKRLKVMHFYELTTVLVVLDEGVELLSLFAVLG